MSIIEQQLKLHYGEDYGEVRHATEKFMSRLLGRRAWWGDNRENLIAAEGGYRNMVNTALAWQVEHDDRTEGLRAYSRFLQREYAMHRQDDGSRNTAHHTNWVGIPESYEYIPQAEERNVDHPGGDGLPSLDGIHSLVRDGPVMQEIIRTPQELEVIETLASVGNFSLSMTAEFLEMPRLAVRNIVRNIRRRAEVRTRQVHPSQ